MQPGDDLEDIWIMFNHIKCVKHYMIFGCHVYDSRYCKVMIIALCDMMLETHDAQAYLLYGLNGVMTKHGVSRGAPLILMHTRALRTYLSGGYLPCKKIYNIWYF